MGARHRAKLKKWSGKVTRESDALDLEHGVFKKRSAHDIARVAEALGRAQPAAQVRRRCGRRCRC